MSTTSKRQPRVSTDSPALGRWCRFADDEAGHRLVVAACRKGDIELLRHFVGGHPAGEEPRAVGSAHGFRPRRCIVRAERPCDGVENVSRCDDALEVPILIVNERHRHLGTAVLIMNAISSRKDSLSVAPAKGAPPETVLQIAKHDRSKASCGQGRIATLTRAAAKWQESLMRCGVGFAQRVG